MTRTRPSEKTLIGKPPHEVPLSAQRVLSAESTVETIWIGPNEAKKLSEKDLKAYDLAHTIMKYLAIEGPRAHKSGHPGGPLSAFTFCYGLLRRRDPKVDSALRMSAGHLSLLAYGLQYLGGKEGNDERLSSPEAIIKHFRTPGGLPGHAEAGIGDIPFGCGPLGKGVSNGLGHALGWKMRKQKGITDVLMGDGDSQEGQIMEAARLASKLEVDNLVVHVDLNDIQLSDIPSKVAACDLAKIFQAMGWHVIEVQNGNDPTQVEAALDAVDDCVSKKRPVIVCYYTTMGHGIETMEKAANAGSAEFHGAPLKDDAAAAELRKLRPLADVIKEYEPFRKDLAKKYHSALPASSPLPSLKKGKRTVTTEKGAARKDFGAVHIKNLMKTDDRIVVLHGDLADSGGFKDVEKEFPHRVINCGAAEANMYMVAAGLRQAGWLPVTYTFAAFGTNEARANARLIDINAGHVPCSVLHDCTHAGLSVGEDGETHQDRNYLNIPFDHTQVWMPADSNQAGAMAEKALNLVAEGRQSVYVFSPRSGQPQLVSPDGSIIYDETYTYDGAIDRVFGAGDVTDQVTVLATGQCVHDALLAAQELVNGEDPIRVRVLNVSCIRPIDAATIVQAALETTHLVVVEDHHSEGGLATQVADIIADFQIPCSLRRLGVNHYFPSGSAEDLKFLAGLDSESIMDAVQDEARVEVHGGEDALVSCIYGFMHHLSFSRFRTAAQPFVDKLLNEPGYLERLREYWKERDVSEDQMPTTQELRRKLGEAAVPDMANMLKDIAEEE
jgi:transketolase